LRQPGFGCDLCVGDLNIPITDFANAGPNASQVLIPGAVPGDSKSIHNVGVNLATGTLRPESGATLTYTSVTTSVAGNLTLVLDESSALPASMANALAYAATYLDKVITNPVAITLQVGAKNLGTGVLGEGSDNSYYMSLAKVDKYIANADPSVASVLPTSLPSGVYGQIQVAELEPGLCAQPAQLTERRPALTPQPPAPVGIADVGQGVGDRIQIRADVKAVDLEVVTGVPDHCDLGVGSRRNQS